MKNFINYFYNISINEFKKVGDSVVFKIDNKLYEFIPFEGNIQDVYKVYSLLKINNKYCHEIILNKDKLPITTYNGKTYLLIRKDIVINKYVDIYEILNYDIPVYGNYTLNWKNLWQEKIDYYEFQMRELSVKYDLISKSFNYYVGLTETAISLLGLINLENLKYYISHKKIGYKEKLDYFYNPIGIIVDSKVRDIAEYIKINFMNDNFELNEAYELLDSMQLEGQEPILFLARLLYPSYYFYMYDSIIQGITDEKKLEQYIEKNASYELFLKKIYFYLKSKFNIPEIEWLNLS